MVEAVEWTAELKERLIAEYLEQEPTPENTTEILKALAEENDVSSNGLRIILSNAGVYVKKVPATKTATKSATDGSVKVSRSESINELRSMITSLGKEVDEAILEKLTGKVAVYFISVLSKS